MKKLLLTLIFFLIFFAIKSVTSSQVLAAGSFTGWLNNNAGSIGANVTLVINKSGGGQVDVQSLYVPSAGRSLFTWNDPSGLDQGPYYGTSYSLPCRATGPTWSTTAVIGSAGSYSIGPDLDVHCTNINSWVGVTGVSCSADSTTGSVSWHVNVAGTGAGAGLNQNAPNISKFRVYKAYAPAIVDSDLNSTVVNYDLASHPTFDYSFSLSGLSSGNWNIAVKAYPPPYPDNTNIYPAPAVITCGSSVSPPANLVASPTCNGATPRVDFTWSAAYLGTFNYVVETSLYSGPASDPGQNGSWTGPTATPSPTTGTYVSKPSGWTSGQTYWAHVKATLSSPPNTVYSSAISIQFTTPSACSTVAHWVYPPAISDVFNCYDLSSSANANQVKVVWYSPNSGGYYSVVTGQEFIDYGTNVAFGAGTYTSVAASGGNMTMTDNNVFPVNGTLYFRTRALLTNGNWYSSQVAPVPMVATCPTAATNTPRPTLMAYADCQYLSYLDGSAQMYYPRVHLHWTSMDNDTGDKTFWVLRNGAAPLPLSNANYTTSYFWDTIPISVSNVVNSQDLLGQTNSWSVYGVDNGGNTRTSLAVSVTNPTACNAPVVSTLGDPNTLTATVAPTCVGGIPSVTFTFVDNTTGETNYELDVSSDPFNGFVTTTRAPSVWGVKSLPLVPSIWSTSTFIWSGTSPLDSGNANPQTTTTTDDLIPSDGVNYFWRIRAINNSSSPGISNYVYPDGAAGTTYWTGKLFSTIPCRPWHDLSVTVDSTSWSKGGSLVQPAFKSNDIVSVDFIVKNNASSAYVTATPSTNDLYFFYKGDNTANGGVTMPDCSVPTPQTTPPSGGVSTPDTPTTEAYTIPILGFGETKRVTVTFNVGSTQGSFNPKAYMVPECAFSDGGTDPVWLNNVSSSSSSTTYTVNVDKFFETKGGDVGASGAIRVGLNSSTFGTPIYQSQYLLAANNLSSNAGSASGGYKISSYPTTSPLVLTGGVYKYFADRFRAKAIANDPLGTMGCTFSAANNYSSTSPGNFYYCGSNVTINSAIFIVTGNPVFFIDGDLNINGNIQMWPSTSPKPTAVFIVSGNINVANSVTNIQGIYITAKSFADGINGGEITNPGVSGKLTITGAVYADGIGVGQGGAFQLVRHWGGTDVGLNATTPSLSITFDPRYIPILNSILATSPVGWKETAP